MKKISQCLNKELLILCEQVRKLGALENAVHELLPLSLSDVCRIGSFSGGKLNLLVSQAVFATELRYYLPTLRDSLRKEPLFAGLVSIKISLVAESNPLAEDSKKEKKKTLLSAAAGKTISDVSQSIGWEPLKEALLRLGSRAFVKK